MRQIIVFIVLLASTVFAYAQKAYDGCADVKGMSRAATNFGCGRFLCSRVGWRWS